MRVMQRFLLCFVLMSMQACTGVGYQAKRIEFQTLGNAPNLQCPVTSTASTIEVNCPVPIAWRAQTDNSLLTTLTPTFEWREDQDTGIRTVMAKLRLQSVASATGSHPFSVRFDFFNKNGVLLFSIQRPLGAVMSCGEHIPLEQGQVIASPRAAVMVKIYGEGGAWRNCL